jgi:hypothetical protein
MTKELKVYGYGDGRNRIIVAATTKKAAREALKISSYEFNRMAIQTRNKEEISLAMANPEKLFMKPNNPYQAPFKEAIALGNRFEYIKVSK